VDVFVTVRAGSSFEDSVMAVVCALTKDFDVGELVMGVDKEVV